MGTNYYARYNACDCCGRYDSAHIGKSQYLVRIWPAALDPRWPDDAPENCLPGTRGETPIRSFADWRAFLIPKIEVPKTMSGRDVIRMPPPPTVWDEYGRQIEDIAGWLDGWLSWPAPDENHVHPRAEASDDSRGYRYDPDGYIIIAHEFS